MSSVSCVSRAARRHREAGDGDLVLEPDRRVAGEEQVGQRVDDEVVMGEQARHESEAATHLVVADPGSDGVGQLRRRQLVHPAGEVAAQRVAEAQARRDLLDGLLARVRVGQRLDQQLDEVEHLDVTVAQRLREGVVLVLGAAHPRHAVEEQAVVVARGQPSELGTRPVQHDGAKAADLAVGAQRGRGTRHAPQPTRRPAGRRRPRRRSGRRRRRCSGAGTAACSAAAPGRR